MRDSKMCGPLLFQIDAYTKRFCGVTCLRVLRFYYEITNEPPAISSRPSHKMSDPGRR